MKHIILLCLISILLFFNFSLTPSENNTELDEMIGQMLMVGFRGFEISESEHIKRDIQQHKIGGVILFDYDVPKSIPERNIKSPDQVQNLTAQLQEISDYPLFIAVDQEGGRVTRLKVQHGFPETVSADYLGKINRPDTTKKYAENTAGLLSDMGFNVNFAPVVDLNINTENPIIGKLGRSFGAEPDLVNTHAEIVIQSHNRHNVLPVLKHFPGHGSAWNDTHVGMADVTDTWIATELDPYRYLLYHYADVGVMTAHVFNSNLDADHPATLSHHIQSDILRGTLAFDGVLFSDDMQMDAIRSYYGFETAVKKAINAGVDVLVFANNSVYDPEIVPKIISTIKTFVENGDISEERIKESYIRIKESKKRLDLL